MKSTHRSILTRVLMTGAASLAFMIIGAGGVRADTVGGGSGALAVFFFFADFVQQGNGFFQFLENRVLHHLSIDHVLELKFVEREDGDHLHQARSQYLALGETYAEFMLQQDHWVWLESSLTQAFLARQQRIAYTGKKPRP